MSHLLIPMPGAWMFYPDLSTECQVASGDHIRAVAWLSNGHPFSTGDVPRDFLAALRAHVLTAWQPVLVMGPHFCDLCPKTNPQSSSAAGAKNVWIPTSSNVYVAPELIVHYIEVHGYRPPDEFIEAVLECPAQGSIEFHLALKRFPSLCDPARPDVLL